MNKKTKKKYDQLVNKHKADFLLRMKKKGYKLIGIATYGEGRDLVFVFEEEKGSIQYYISYMHFIEAIEQHRYYEWREQLFSDLFAEEV